MLGVQSSKAGGANAVHGERANLVRACSDIPMVSVVLEPRCLNLRPAWKTDSSD